METETVDMLKDKLRTLGMCEGDIDYFIDMFNWDEIYTQDTLDDYLVKLLENIIATQEARKERERQAPQGDGS
jgi:hypothetical protein